MICMSDLGSLIFVQIEPDEHTLKIKTGSYLEHKLQFIEVKELERILDLVQGVNCISLEFSLFFRHSSVSHE